MDIFQIALIVAVGITAGFLNTVAGGGSLIVMPVLIFMGLPSAVANGTNRVALVAQNVVATANFRKKGFFNVKLSIIFAVPAALGAVIGSGVAVSLPDEVFNRILAVVMLVVMALIIWNPQKKAEDSKQELTLKHKIVGAVVFFCLGIYGGFIQAGIGFVIIASLVLITGYSLVRVNSLKVFIVAVYMVASLVIFILNGKVNWIYGICLAVGNSIGAYLGSSFSVKKEDKWIKAVLVVTVIAMAIKLSGIFKI